MASTKSGNGRRAPAAKRGDGAGGAPRGPKEPRRRQRYVLFESADHEALSRAYAALRLRFNDWKVGSPTVIETRGSVTIMKCCHLDADGLRATLNSVEGVRTLKTSGTLRALRRGMA